MEEPRQCRRRLLNDHCGEITLLARTTRAVATAGARVIDGFLRRLERQAPATEPQHSARAVPMARKSVLVVVDDISGNTLPDKQGQTVRFGLDGQDYEIDLSADNAADFRRSVRRYVDAGRRPDQRAPQRATRARATKPATKSPGREDTAAIRQWARSHGHQVSDRGRIPSDVLQAYAARR